MVDYVVDQLLFFRTAWEYVRREGVDEEATLMILEALALAEACRLAGRSWRRGRLLKEFPENARWRSILEIRSPRSDPARFPRLVSDTRELSPFPAATRRPRDWLVELQARYLPAGGLPPSPEIPFRRMHDGTAWLLRLEMVRLDIVKPMWNGLEVIVDLPRQADRESTQRHLEGRIRQLEQFRDGPAGPEPLRQQAGARATWFTRVLDGLRRARRPRAAHEALQATFAKPGELWSALPTVFVTEDMGREALATLLGIALDRQGALSEAGRRHLAQFLEVAHAKPTDSGELDGQGRVIARKLRAFQRPLEAADLRSYIAKAIHGVQVEAHQRRQEAEATHEGLRLPVPEAEERMPPGVRSQSELPAKKGRFERGARLRVRLRHGLSPRQFSRKFRAYCEERDRVPDPAALKAFDMMLRRQEARLITPEPVHPPDSADTPGSAKGSSKGERDAVAASAHTDAPHLRLSPNPISEGGSRASENSSD